MTDLDALIERYEDDLLAYHAALIGMLNATSTPDVLQYAALAQERHQMAVEALVMFQDPKIKRYREARFAAMHVQVLFAGTSRPSEARVDNLATAFDETT